MNTIGKILFHFHLQNESFARNLYGRWDSFFANSVEHVADEVLGKLEMRNKEFEIDKLELDLGSLFEEKLDEQFPMRFREKLEEALSQCLYHTEKQQGIVKRVSQEENAFQLLCGFLLHGTLPWNASGENGDIHTLFLKVLQKNSATFKQFLQRYGHYTSLQQRLVYQLHDAELEIGVYLLAPESGNFIVGYVHFLHAKYKETETRRVGFVIRHPETTESNYRNAVWLVIYAYLLTQRSSYFDKKSFITQTILQIAAKYNLSYNTLIAQLTHELETYLKKYSIPLELFQILGALQKELSEKRLKESFVDAAKFYKTIYTSIKKELEEQISETSREGLMHILANPSSCRMFLQQLNETEIIRLVPVVVPRESNFVIKMAHTLQQQKEKGALQGKAGGELRLLKWQFIFPILLEKRGTRFNRKQFVRSVLQQIAAHYNLDFRLLLDYFIPQSEILAQTDHELKSIFSELHKEYFSNLGFVIRDDNEFVPKLWVDKEGEAIHKDTLHLVLRNLTSLQRWALPQIKQTLRLFSDSSFRKKIIDCTHETERYRLVQRIYPKEQEFIISYVKSLDKLDKHNLLEGKTEGNFADVKWMFLFTVLSQMPEDSFNRRFFVCRVLHQVAAHYNLTYFDLLLYFRQEKVSLHLPFGLEQLLDKLYQEEKGHWLELVLKNGIETDQIRYLTYFKGVDVTFVKTYLKILDHYHDKGRLQGKTSGNLKELKWRFIFEVILEFQHIAFNKGQFVRRSLTHIAAHYQLSLYELLDYLKEISTVSGDIQSKEIEMIIQEFYLEQEKKHKSTSQKKSIDKNITFPQKEKWNQKLEELSKSNPILIVYTEKKSEPEENKPIREIFPEFKKIENMETQTLFIHNAGLVLLTPYLPRLFSMLGLTENGETMFGVSHWKNQDAQIRAIYLLQYIVFGKTDFPEHELMLNRLLTGFKSGIPLPQNIKLTENEVNTIDSMLKAVLQHWSKMKNTSIYGLQEGFLQREGKLEEKEDYYPLTVEEKAYDMLLDSVPWSFRTIKYSWMEKGIQVKWR